MNKKTLSAEQLDRLAKLDAMPDEEIDTSDIPEIPDEAWRYARRPGLYKPVKQPVTMRLDADIIAWFKAHADGRPYQTEINRVLRRHVAEASKRRA
jgi:uncharacterized protein (DUF4415 family)